MKPKELFAVILRVLAILGLMYVFRSVVRHPGAVAYTQVVRVIALLIGLYMIRGAPLLVKFAYPECQCCDTPEKPAA